MSEYSGYNGPIIGVNAPATAAASAVSATQELSLYQGARILLVEPDKAVAALLSEWLGNEQYNIDVREDGASALERIYNEPYDLIIVNRQLSDVSGIDVCKRYRAIGGETPMIVTSNVDCIEDKEECFEAGVNDYLIKPYNLREMSARIRAKIRRAKSFGFKSP